MTDRELKKLNRRELLEMLIAQTRRAEMLEKKLSEVNGRLEDKTLSLKDAGNLADAVLKLNGVFEAANNASLQYLENIKRMEVECSAECKRLIDEAEEKARIITLEAEEKARQITDEVQKRAQKMISAAEKKNKNNNKKKKK